MAPTGPVGVAPAGSVPRLGLDRAGAYGALAS